MRLQFHAVVHATLRRSLALAPLALTLLCSPASAQHGFPPGPPPPVREPSGATQPPSEADLERARSLFAEGLAFVAQQDWHHAAERFTQVRAIRSSPVVSYNLASALAELGQRVESSKLLTQVLSDPLADGETRNAALLLLSKIEPQIGALTISVYGKTEDCRFSLDGQPLAIAGREQSLRVDIGQHTVAVERDGATILSPQITIGGTFPMQAQLALEVPARLQPTQVALPPARKTVELRLSQPSAPPRDGESLLEQWWLWAGAGAVVAGAIVATVVLTSSDDPSPDPGDTNPPLIHTRVLGSMR